MRRKIYQLLPVAAAMLSACAGDSQILTGPELESVEVEQVRLVFGYPVQCDYDALAIFEISGGYFSRESIVEEFRELGADVGADVVQIQYLQKRNVGEFLGQARALRCIDQDPTGQLSESSSSSSSS